MLNARIIFEAHKKTTPFTDVPVYAYYADAVKWAYENGVTTGTTETTFGPEATCTRGQVVTFLWRAKGCPEPISTDNPFTDVKETDYFYKAVLWAVENGITNGTSETTFAPNATCTSGQVVTFLWRANGKPMATGESTLVESGQWYSEAVAWADTAGILNRSDLAFLVVNDSPRSDIVTYLYYAVVPCADGHNYEEASATNGYKVGSVITFRCTLCEHTKEEEVEPLVLTAYRSGAVSISGWLMQVGYTANTTGGYGKYEYRFEVYTTEYSTSPALTQDFSEENSMGWTSRLYCNGHRLIITVRDEAGNKAALKIIVDVEDKIETIKVP